MKRILTAAVFSVMLFNTCEKEVSLTGIDGIPEAMAEFDEGIRIEAILYPEEKTALVRIDRMVSLDEDSLFNCEDDDGDWRSFTDLNNNGRWNPGEPLNDDLGEDGMQGDPWDEDRDLDFSEASTGEGNGRPDCGEPNVDEYDEVLPQLHISDCEEVKITGPDGTEYFLHFDSEADRLKSYPEYDPAQDYLETYLYGGWVPEDTIAFNLDPNAPVSERIYTFSCQCGNYGSVTAADTVFMPVDFYADSLGQKPLEGNINNFPALLGLLSDCEVENFLHVFKTQEEISFQSFFFQSRPEERSFWITANEVDHISLETCEYRTSYIHGQALYAPEDPGYSPDVNVMSTVIGEIPAIYVYDVQTMSAAYERYFLFSDLNLLDPVRGNLRNDSNEVVPGVFGSLTTSHLFAIVLPPPTLDYWLPEIGPDTLSFQMVLNYYVPFGSFEFSVTGMDILALSEALAENPDWAIDYSENRRITASLLSDDFLPANNNVVLFRITGVRNNSSPVCFENGLIYIPMNDDYYWLDFKSCDLFEYNDE